MTIVWNHYLFYTSWTCSASIRPSVRLNISKILREIIKLYSKVFTLSLDLAFRTRLLQQNVYTEVNLRISWPNFYLLLRILFTSPFHISIFRCTSISLVGHLKRPAFEEEEIEHIFKAITRECLAGASIRRQGGWGVQDGSLSVRWALQLPSQRYPG